MADSPGQQKESRGAGGRRSTRLAISVPITISGRDSAGRTFKENTKTLTINRYGAKVPTLHELASGAEVTIENRSLGETAKATVVWVGERASPKDPLEIELQLTKVQNIWGIEFPPSDWKEDVPAGVEGRSAATLPVDSSKIAIGAAVAQFAQMAQEAAQGGLEFFEKRLAKLANESGIRSEASLREAANRLEEKTIRSLEQQVGVLEGRLRASHDEFETLLAKFQDLQKGIQAEVEKTQHDIQDASGQALQAALVELEEKVRKDLDGASSGFVQQTRQFVPEEASAAMEALSQKISRHLASLTEDLLSKARPELRARQKQITEDTRTQVAQVLEATSTQVREKIHQIANEVAPSLRTEMEASLVEYAGQLIKRLTQFYEEQTQASHQAAEESLRQSFEKVQQAIRQVIVSAGTRDNHTTGAGHLFRKALTALRHLLFTLKNAWRNLLRSFFNVFNVGLALSLL